MTADACSFFCFVRSQQVLQQPLLFRESHLRRDIFIQCAKTRFWKGSPTKICKARAAERVVDKVSGLKSSRR